MLAIAENANYRAHQLPLVRIGRKCSVANFLLVQINIHKIQNFENLEHQNLEFSKFKTFKIKNIKIKNTQNLDNQI